MTRKQKKKPVVGTIKAKPIKVGGISLVPDASIVSGSMDSRFVYQGYGWFGQRADIEKAFEEKHGFRPKEVFRYKLVIMAGPVRKVAEIPADFLIQP